MNKYFSLLLLPLSSCSLFFFALRFECGDNVIKSGEECDDGNTDGGDGCDESCLLEVCGNGIAQPPEACDDGDANSDDRPDACRLDCQLARCGDNVQDSAEGCDDGNALEGDGCNAACQAEVCGDGILSGPETCDDNNTTSGDGCDDQCSIESCGDGVVQTLLDEVCDDGNNEDGDGCRADCAGEEICGDALLDVTEECEDQNALDGDGCSALCVIERCGDGVFNDLANERCDDGSGLDNDGCDNDCQPSEALLVSSGGAHTCLLSRRDDARCFGANAVGQLGYGNTTAIGDNEPARQAGDLSVGVALLQISSGGSHTCALTVDGGVRCWGAGADGRLGYANVNNLGNDPGETPDVIGDVNLGAQAIQITAGLLHTCAVTETGGVRCWGSGANGRLGYGNSNSIGDNEIPAIAGDVNVGGAVAQVSAGNAHTCARLNNGAVRCWGLATSGQLGYGNITSIGDDEPPANGNDVSIGGSALQVAAGGLHTCALLDGGDVRCWGANASGQLGLGNTILIGDNELPGTVGPINLGGAATQITAGAEHTCALLDTGNVRCWGEAGSGQLGYGNTTDIGDSANEFPATVGDVNVGGVVTQISAGEAHTCVLLSAGSIRCWGTNAAGQLGYGLNVVIGDSEFPAQAGDVPVF